MKILHYFLGFPPFRSGGLTKYSLDLMGAQVEQGKSVLALWPGRLNMFRKLVYIKKNHALNGIENFEIINPLPVSLDEGVTEFHKFLAPCDYHVYYDFLEKANPDAIHIHTLMGLHKEFLIAADKLGIRTIFTTHDYYGLCPKVTFYRYGNVCDDDNDCMNCIQCNTSALSISKIRLLQSPLYRRAKNFKPVRILRSKHRNSFLLDGALPELKITKSECVQMAAGYKRLRAYYLDMLSDISMIHFNSTVSKSIYERFFEPQDSRVMAITHRNIADNRKSRKIKASKLRLTFLSGIKSFKGFNVIKDALDSLWESGAKNFELMLFSPVANPSPYMRIQNKKYDYSELEDIFAHTDVLLAPSVWYETFGFTVLEAISYGVPVIVSNHVGAKDIIGEGGLVVAAGSVDSLKKAISALTPEKLHELRKNIQKKVEIKTWNKFLEENDVLYRGK